MKHKLRLISAAAAAAILFSGCSMKLSVDDDKVPDEDQEISVSDTENLSTRDASVSIIQYSDYTSLNECCTGVKKALDQAGIGYEVTVGSDHKEKSDCEQKASEIATNSACDLVVCIGTPCAEAVFPIINSAGRTPVIFAAVTDPVGAGIVNNINSPGVNCTGVSTAFNISEQLNMINTFQPSITRLGVMYTESESNTKQQLETLKKGAKKLGITVYDVAVEDPSEYREKAADLMKKTEAVMLLPDNMTAKNSWNITERSIVEKVPLYGVTLPEISEGCLAGYCYDFESIGEQAGAMAVDVLHGESASDMPVVTERGGTLYVNKDRLKDLDMTIPDEYADLAEQVGTSYENAGK